jgi:glycosyltransferase involved in cell wall biosynthesis
MSAKADLHVHSKASNRPSEWILRQFGAPESFTEPRRVYRLCRERGMDFVTLSDHDTLDGALEIAHLPGTFLSEEVTVEFPEDGCEIHCLAIGISEAQHRDIQGLRKNVYELRDYLEQNAIVHSVAHPLFRVNDRLTLDQVEKLLVLFNRFEARNGIHDRRANELVERIFGSLTRELIERLAERHRLRPSGPTPWIKAFTGGSDDHGGHYVATTWTETTEDGQGSGGAGNGAGARDDGGSGGGAGAATVAGYLAALRAGRHRPGGDSGSSLRLTRSLYSIAHEYYRRQFPLGLGSRRDPIGELLRAFALGGGGEGAGGGGDRGGRGFADLLAVGRRRGREGGDQLERGHDREGEGGPRGAARELQGGRAERTAGERATFAAANRASQEIAQALMNAFSSHLRRGRLAEGLGAAAAQLAPLAVTVAPFLVSLQAQHKDADLLTAAALRFLGRRPEEALGGGAESNRKAWFTDTLTDVNGVAKTVRTLAGLARRRGRRLLAITCGESHPPPDLAVHDFRPFASFPIPGYESQILALPPLLEVLEHCERERYSEILISTPGPLGLAGLAAGKLLGIPVTGIYHTDFPLYVRHLAGSAKLEELTWTYMRWFFGSMERVLVASRCYLGLLAEHGLDPARLSLLPRGVDADFFHPGKREPRFWERFGLGGGFKFLYVGRVSREKNLDALLGSFLAFLGGGGGGRRAELVVVGDGPYLKELADRFRRPEILFTGFLHGEDLASTYAGADLFVFPSTSDTFGNVVLEAQAAGLPAIVSDRGGPREIVVPGETGLVVAAGEPEALTAAMVRLFDDPALLAEMSARAVDHARRHSWELLLERLFQSPAAATASTTSAAAAATPSAAASPAAPSAASTAAPSAASTAGAGYAPPIATTIAAWHNRQS